MSSLDYLLSFQRFGIKLGLDNITYLLARLGNPHHRFAAIHITGTNGKGSVAAFLCAVLTRLGLRVGCYISPHLIDFSERIVINELPVRPDEIDELVAEIRPIVHDMQQDSRFGHPTFFEAVTAMAFQQFARRSVDLAVVEVGMGGRYDSTNVVRSCLSIITNVELEHREYLGDTLEKIAIEKAGIIKPGIDVVSAAEQPEVKRIIDSKAAECDSKVYYASADFHFDCCADAFPRQWLQFTSPWTKLTNVEINLPGRFQAQNAAVALMSLELLQRRGIIPWDERVLRAGMANAFWPARLEKLSDSPLLLLDGAHNPAAIRSMVEAVRQLFPERRIVPVLGMLADKDALDCLRILRTLTDRIIVTQPSYERALPARKLASLAHDVFPDVRCHETIAKALQEALTVASPRDIIIVTGSLFNVAEVRRFISNLVTETNAPRI